MAATLIDRIEIRKDGVYLSTHLPEDTGSYKTWKSEELSEAYQRDGQKGLDREMFRVLYEYAALGDFHKSTARYHRILIFPKQKHFIGNVLRRLPPLKKVAPVLQSFGFMTVK